MRGTGGRAPLFGIPKDIRSNALEMDVCFHRGPVLGNIEGHSFPRAFERRVRFFIRRNFIEEFERSVKEGSRNGQLSLHRPPLRSLEGVLLPGLLRER
jgi:hypothetical protein